MKSGIRLSDLLEDVIGQDVVVDCKSSCYHGWRGKVVEFCGMDSSRIRSDNDEAGVNVVCEMLDAEDYSIKTLSFSPSALRFA